jgi:peptidoglycan/LPS O-acetylase OafA/YrhL
MVRSSAPAELRPDFSTDLDARLPGGENRRYYPALDGLRAIAVLMVFTTHYIGLPAALNWGWTGVDLFFVLSGFLITGILYDSRHTRHRFRVFYIRRALRIFPVYYLVLVVGVLLYAVFHWQLHPGLWLWPAYLGNYARLIWPAEFTANTAVYEDLRSGLRLATPFFYHLDHLWSLCVEEQFYLVWPFVIFTVKDRVRLRNLCVAVVVAMPAIRLVCLIVQQKELIDLGLLHRVTPLRADSLLLGGAIALALRGPEREWVVALAKPVARALIGLLLALEIAFRLWTGQFIDSVYAGRHTPFAYSLLALFAGAVILLALDPRSRVYRVCMNSKLRALGQRSYGFYVYHLLLFSAFRWVALALCLGHKAYIDQATTVVALTGTIALSWMSFRYFERPLLRLKDRYARAEDSVPKIRKPRQTHRPNHPPRDQASYGGLIN